MAGIFSFGIKTANGIPRNPAISFLSDPTTGIFLNSSNSGNQSLGLSNAGSTVALFDTDITEIFSNLKLANGAVNNAVLTSDQTGIAHWKVSKLSGSFKWNSIYNNLDTKTQNNQIDITFPELDSIPIITISKESEYVIDDFEPYIKNKSKTGFSIFSNSFMFKSLVTANIGESSVFRLSNGGICICYYNITIDRICYIYSLDKTNMVFSTPIIIDDISAIGMCNITLIGDRPAIAYAVDNDVHDEWRFIIAKDIMGATWNMPVVVSVSVADIAFFPIGLYLRYINARPVIFMNTETGQAQMIRANDESGLTWAAPVKISNLISHQILGIRIIEGNPAIIAKSNQTNSVYYVRSLDSYGITWPIGATQIYKENKVQLATNNGKSCNTFGIINNQICIIVSELISNSLYIAYANDILGTTWGDYTLLTKTNTTSACPRIYQNNNRSSVVYNNYTGLKSEKKIIEFTGIIPGKPESFISTLDLCTDHHVLSNINDDNNIIIITYDGHISLLKYFNSDFTINWIAMT